MTYLHLAQAISLMSNEQKNQTVTIYESSLDEYHLAKLYYLKEQTGLLEVGTPVLRIDWD